MDDNKKKEIKKEIEKEIEKVEETKDEMNVVVVKKKGIFTRVGECLDRNKKKIAVGLAATAAGIGMLIFVGGRRKSTDEDPSIYDEGFSSLDVDHHDSNFDTVTSHRVVNND